LTGNTRRTIDTDCAIFTNDAVCTIGPSRSIFARNNRGDDTTTDCSAKDRNHRRQQQCSSRNIAFNFRADR
jgi:hypothetical protein